MSKHNLFSNGYIVVPSGVPICKGIELIKIDFKIFKNLYERLGQRTPKDPSKKKNSSPLC